MADPENKADRARAAGGRRPGKMTLRSSIPKSFDEVRDRFRRFPLGATIWLATLVLVVLVLALLLLKLLAPSLTVGIEWLLMPAVAIGATAVYIPIFYFLGKHVVGLVRRKKKGGEFLSPPRFELVPTFFTSYIAIPFSLLVFIVLGFEEQTSLALALLVVYPIPFILGASDYFRRRKAYLEATADGVPERWKRTLKKLRRIEKPTVVGSALRYVLVAGLSFGPPALGIYLIVRSVLRASP